jgi:hypothetical protein
MVSEQFRKAVLAYRYSSPNLSFMEWFCLNQFWERVTLLYPMWLAPNVITLMGFLCIVVGYVFNLVASPEGLGSMPEHLYPVLAVLVFIYQTLDGSDGKQARRTKSGSALGELMDHGVDAVTTGLIASFFTDAFGFGLRSPLPWVLFFGAQVRTSPSLKGLCPSPPPLSSDFCVLDSKLHVIPPNGKLERAAKHRE